VNGLVKDTFTVKREKGREKSDECRVKNSAE